MAPGERNHLHSIDTERPQSLVSLDGAPRVKEFLALPAQHNHIVQFYEDDGFLCDHVAHFLGAGLGAGEPIVVIATELHRKAFVARLRLQSFDVDAAIASGQLTLLDARETLARFMVGDQPDWEKFESLVGGVLEKSLAGRGPRVRAYGEMVDLLWRDGNREAAIELEHLWNRLGQSHTFSLLCAYVMGNFYNSGDRERFLDVCRSHTHVIPTESYSAIGEPDARLREISLLQQRARALENEIEERKKLEEALRQTLARERAAREEAERSVRFNEMFAGMLGHDLRNPLGAIVMGASYIARADSGERATRAANRIVSSAERMSRMIDQLLDFTRIRVGGGLALQRTRCDLAELCYRVKDELEAANPECFITFDTRGDTSGEWDYDRLLQVFSNLVGNAIHHGSAGVHVGLRTDGSDSSDVVAFVHNAGEVPADVLPVLFEPFRGGHKVERTRGLGLGLYITRQIVVAHGGNIEVETGPEDGTTVRVRLPRKPVQP